MTSQPDNPDLPGDLLLLRRVKPIAASVEWAGDRLRPTSAVFRDGRGELSVSLNVAGKLDDFKARFPDAGVVAFTVAHIRNLGYHIVPMPEADDPDHHVICDAVDRNRECLHKKHAQSLARGTDYSWQYQPQSLLDIARAKAGAS